jgi:hypothetical protein
MKQCPKCNSTCEDSDVICRNCGYLFSPNGYGDNSTEGSGSKNGYGVPPQNGAPTQNGYGVPPQNGAPTQNGYGTPTQNGTPPQNGYGTPNGIPGQPQYPGYQGSNPYYPGQGGNPNFVEQHTNGMSIASLVLGIVGVVGDCCYGLGTIFGIVSLILGIISMQHIKKAGGKEKGEGFALASIILGAVSIVLGVIIIIAIIVNRTQIFNMMQSYMQTYNSSNG